MSAETDHLGHLILLAEPSCYLPCSNTLTMNLDLMADAIQYLQDDVGKTIGQVPSLEDNVQA